MSKTLSISISASALIVFTLTLSHFSVNLPSRDDFAATLYFIQTYYFNNPDTVDKITSLFIPHNEHCILPSKLSAAISYLFTGHLNFAALVWYQNIFLLGGFALTLQIIRQQKLPLWALLAPISLFFFTLSFWQVSLYYWGGIQHYTVFFFAILSLYCLHLSRDNANTWFVGGILAATLAVVSFGNGIIVLPVGFLLLWGQQQRKPLFIWAAFSLIVVTLFLLNFHGFSTPKAAFNPLWAGKLFFTFLGSFLYVNPPTRVWSYANIILCSTAGLGVLFIWFRLLVGRYVYKNPLLYSLLTLTILTALLIALGRFETKAAGGIAPRYMYFSTCIPVFLLLMYADLQKRRDKKMPMKTITSLTLLIWGLSYVNNIRVIEEFNQENLATYHRWQQDHHNPLVPAQNHDPRYSEVLIWAMENRVYIPPAHLLSAENKSLVRTK